MTRTYLGMKIRQGRQQIAAKSDADRAALIATLEAVYEYIRPLEPTELYRADDPALGERLAEQVRAALAQARGSQ